jgi:hypothetical protein
MLKLNKLYRRSYVGENIIAERNYTNGVWQDTTELVPNAVTNNQISNKAIVIGNGPSRLDLDLALIKNHRGGLLGSGALQSYGCNALYRDFTPHFLVAVGNDIIRELSTKSYVDDNIVYTDSMHLLEYPNKFYLIPYNPYTDTGTAAAYIAAFDGHRTVYLLGFDGQDTPGYNYNVYAGTAGYDALRSTVSDAKWIADRQQLFNTYNDTEFVRVTKKGTEPIPESWKYCTNFRAIGFNQFKIEVDL